MNILLVTQEDILAGSTYSVSYLAKGLAARGHFVAVAARPGSVLDDVMKGSGILFLPYTIKSRFDTSAMLRLKLWTEEYKIDIINAQSSKDRYITVLARLFFRMRVVVVHTRRQVSLSVGGFFQNLIYVNGTDKIVAVSDGVKKSLMKNHIPEKHIEVIHNGTPADKYSRIDDEVVRRLANKFSITPSDLIVGCVSRRKKQDQLLKALKFVTTPVKVIFVGITEDEELMQIRNEWQVKHRIYYEGEIPGDEAIHYYKLFTCTVLCSTIEGLSQGLLESMYLGTPVIATAAAGNLDLLNDGENGLLFRDEDVEQLARQIELIKKDESLRNRLISGGITTASDTFSIERTVVNYEKLFDRLLTSRKIN